MRADKLLDGNDIENALQAVGELLAADGHRLGIVVHGGAALSLLGIVDRATWSVSNSKPQQTNPQTIADIFAISLRLIRQTKNSQSLRDGLMTRTSALNTKSSSSE
jgi:hypothetical protein